MFLIDTNILSELTKKHSNRGVLEFISNRRDIIISVVTLHEIVYGIERSPESKKYKLQKWLSAFLAEEPEVLLFDRNIARISGIIRANVEQKGRSMSFSNSVIAASAQIRKLTLVTRNTRDFEYCGLAMLNPFR